MKILLNGATGGSNFGDFLFAEAFQKNVSSLMDEANVYWYDSRYTMSYYFKKYLKNNKKYKLKEIDALICISGGYFCGNDHGLKDYIIRYLMYFHLCIRCIQKKIPVAIIGVEVGIPNNLLMKYIQKYILKYASLVVVRNEESLRNLKEYGINKGILSADSAHAIVKELYLKPVINEKIKKMFVHVDQNYVAKQESLIDPLNNFLSNHPEYEVYLGTDQCYKNENELYDFLEKINCRNKHFLSYDYPTQLCTVLNEMDFIITPKLHVGIVGATLSKSVVSFSIHTEKIKRFYNQINESERSMPIGDLEKEKALEIMEKYHEKKIILDKSIIELSYKNFEYLRRFLEDIEKDIETCSR